MLSTILIPMAWWPLLSQMSFHLNVTLLRCLLTPREFLGIGGSFIRETLKMSVKTDWHQAPREGLTEPLSYSPHTSVGQTASDLRDETWSCGLVF